MSLLGGDRGRPCRCGQKIRCLEMGDGSRAGCRSERRQRPKILDVLIELGLVQRSFEPIAEQCTKWLVPGAIEPPAGRPHPRGLQVHGEAITFALITMRQVTTTQDCRSTGLIERWCQDVSASWSRRRLLRQTFHPAVATDQRSIGVPGA